MHIDGELLSYNVAINTDTAKIGGVDEAEQAMVKISILHPGVEVRILTYIDIFMPH